MQCAEISENLQTLTEKHLSLHECRLAHLRERARLLSEEFADQPLCFLQEAFRQRYLEEKCALPPALAEVPREHQNDLVRQSEQLLLEDTVYLCRVLMAYYRKRHDDPLSPVVFCASQEPELFPIQTDRIAYLKNAFADEAYNKFSRILPGAVVSYCDDFPGVCEEVAHGRARYGILPLENSADGPLKTFRNLMQKYDLKIVLLCNVPMGESVTRFALLGRRIVDLDCGRHRAASFLEFRIALPQTAMLAHILRAAAYYGLQLLRSESAEGAQGVEFDLLFSQETADVAAFLCFLTLEYPQFNPVGLYTSLKN